MKFKLTTISSLLLLMCSAVALSASTTPKSTSENSASALGWVVAQHGMCGGYYVDQPFIYPASLTRKNALVITTDQPIFALHGTSFLPNVTIHRVGQQLTAKKSEIYRDKHGRLSAVKLTGHVRLREPQMLIVAQTADVDLVHKTQILDNVAYRSAIYDSDVKPTFANDQIQTARRVTHLSAWGEAKQISQTTPGIYGLVNANYSTCPPINTTWRIQAKKIILDKNSGRGSAWGAKLYFKKTPILYAPYFNFPIDHRRETGFLFPYYGRSTKSGAQVSLPFYWNIAPNADLTLTPTLFKKRGLELTNTFRYLTQNAIGLTTFNFLPRDEAFAHFKQTALAKFGGPKDPVAQANLNRLEKARQIRGAIHWNHTQTFNTNWSANVNYSAVSDDYFLSDLRNNLDEVTENQLLQEANLNYKSEHWNFTGRLQAYQTLHPVDVDAAAQFKNQYSRLPQLTLAANYPQAVYGLDLGMNDELTHFSIRPTPGTDDILPTGNRLHVQPSISWPLQSAAFYLTPRLQGALTKYELTQQSASFPHTINRALPILDINAGVYFDRPLQLLGQHYQWSFEPQLTYTFIPYRNQDRIPVFETIYTTLTFDQLFGYNRFSGLDRIGDTNQLSVGFASRLLNSRTGTQRARLGVGQIFYFKQRKVNLCSLYDVHCVQPFAEHDNDLKRSPLAAVLDYQLTASLHVSANAIWNLKFNQMDNQTVGLQYNPDPMRVINLNYNFVRNGDVQPGFAANNKHNDLKQTDFSFAWPIMDQWSAVGRLTRSINEGHFQNMLAGLQYDSCCWAVRLIAGKSFVKLTSPNSTPQYNNQVYMQFALKGLGSFGSDPTQLLSSISGYNPNFGKNY